MVQKILIYLLLFSSYSQLKFLVFSYISLLTQLPPFAIFSIFDRKMHENRTR